MGLFHFWVEKGEKELLLASLMPLSCEGPALSYFLRTIKEQGGGPMRKLERERERGKSNSQRIAVSFSIKKRNSGFGATNCYMEYFFWRRNLSNIAFKNMSLLQFVNIVFST